MRKFAIASALLAGAAPRAVYASPRADVKDDPKALIAELNTAFAEFKTQNDARLKQLEGNGEDPVTAEQVEKINSTLGELQTAVEDQAKKLAAAKLNGGGADITPEAKEHARAFNGWFRKGAEPASGMRELEVKATLTSQSDPDGGYLVPVEMEDTIDRVLGTVSAIRSIANVRPISTTEYKKLVNMAGTGSGWVGEEESRPATATPTLREIAITAMELYANPFASQGELDDARIDVAQWLADEVSIAFAEKEGAAFVNGTGVKQPFGMLQYPTVDNGSYAWGSLGFVVSGAAAAFAATNPADALISLYFALKQGYRNGATFVTSDVVMATIRKFKDGQGNYLFSPPTGVDVPASLLGKPIVTDDNMPALGAGAFPVAFGNFKRGYTIVDRMGIRVLRDPYTNKPFVGFYTTKRVGGGVTNFEAIKLLKCST
jgi:HK97 family phage major capsid protein